MKNVYLVPFFFLILLSYRNQSHTDVANAETHIDTLAEFRKDRDSTIFGKVFRYHTEFEELKDYQNVGSMVVCPEFYKDEFKYGMTWLVKGKEYIVLFEEFVNSSGKENSNSKILDTIHYSAGKNESLQFGNCQLDTIPDGRIIAIVRIEKPEELYNQIVRAWVLDTITRKIKSIDVRNVSCWSEGCGSYEETEE